MAAQRGPKRKKLAAKPDKVTAIKDEKIKVEAKDEKAAKLKTDEPLAKAQKALRAAQVEVKRERQARIQAEEALTQAQAALAIARLKVEQESPARVRRVSFVVRVTVGEDRQLGRTEIEHVPSSRKQNFLSLDGERLAAFIKSCISPTIVLEDAISTIPPPEKVKNLTVRPLRPKSSLIVSDVRVFRLEDPNFFTFVLTPEEPFIVQARFQFQGPASDSPTTQEPSYEIKVYANELNSGKSKLLKTHNAMLIPDVLEYTAPVKLPGLPPGLYRLFTVVILGTPSKLAGFFDKTIIRVI